METSRRAFLGGITTLAAGMVLDPEFLIWKPGVKTIFLPPPRAMERYYETLVQGAMMKIGPQITRARYLSLVGREPVWMRTGAHVIQFLSPTYSISAYETHGWRLEGLSQLRTSVTPKWTRSEPVIVRRDADHLIR